MAIGADGGVDDRADGYFSELPEPASGGKDRPSPTGNPSGAGVYELGEEPARREESVRPVPHSLII